MNLRNLISDILITSSREQQDISLLIYWKIIFIPSITSWFASSLIYIVTCFSQFHIFLTIAANISLFIESFYYIFLGLWQLLFCLVVDCLHVLVVVVLVHELTARHVQELMVGDLVDAFGDTERLRRCSSQHGLLSSIEKCFFGVHISVSGGSWT